MNKKLRCVIVDDEAHAINLLHRMIKSHPHLSLYRSYTNPLQALADIRAEDRIDILFLDIDMPEISGIELATRIRDKVTFLIFTTAYPDFALKAFEVSASQFLVKPIVLKTFLDAIDRLKYASTTVQQSPAETESDDALYIKMEVKGKVIRVAKEDIIYVEPIKGSNYINLVTRKEKFKLLSSINYITELLENDSRFMRINRSYIIQLSAILTFRGNEVQLGEGHKAIIGSAYRDAFMEYISKKLLNRP